ncbi:MAG: hypothetical protein ACRD3I_08520 [Terriglobales bacterium]
MIRDVRRSFEYYFGNPSELPRQVIAWWGRQDVDTQLAVWTLLGICAAYSLFYLRPAIGSALALVSPYGWINTNFMRGLFFRGTRSEFEKSWKKKGQPTSNRARYLADAIYYWGPVLVVAIALAAAFMVFVGYPGFWGEYLR